MREDDREFIAGSLINYSRYIFEATRGIEFRYNWHHGVICDALERVLCGLTKRLIINIPPRFSKTQLAVIDFTAWALGHFPDSEFIHASYAATLAANNSYQIRNIIQHEAYREIFPHVTLASDSKARHWWRTAQGGAFYAAGEGGAITGFGSGKVGRGWGSQEFGGCFPYEARIHTDKGLIEIGRIVEEGIDALALSYDYQGNLQYSPITERFINPPNHIGRVSFDDGSFLECTPDHELWTDNRGWVRAECLSVDDWLPVVNCPVKSSDGISIDTKLIGGWFDSSSILSSSSVGSILDGNPTLFFGEYGVKVSVYTPFMGYVSSASYMLPCLASPYLVDSQCANSIFFSEFGSLNAYGIINFNNLACCEDGFRVDVTLAECSVPLAVNDIRSPCVISEVIEPVISGVSVVMTNIKSIWPYSDKCAHNNLVNASVFDSRTPRKANSEILPIESGGFKNLSFYEADPTRACINYRPVFTLNPSKVTYRIKPFISGYRKPVFFSIVGHNDVTYCIEVKGNHNFTTESGMIAKNCVILDDLHKAKEAKRSAVSRQSIIDWFKGTIETRLNDQNTPIIVIMQRLHAEDIAGWLLGGGNGEAWEHLNLPAINSDGTALWPEKMSLEELRRFEQSKPYEFAGQYMQRPAPEGGGMFKTAWFSRRYTIAPNFLFIVQSWDTAQKDNLNRNDPSVCTTWGVAQDGYYLLDVYKKHLEYPDLLQKIKDLAGRWNPTNLLIEDKSSGTSAIQELRRSTRLPIIAIEPKGSKVDRAEGVSGFYEAGKLVLPESAPWLAEFIAEHELFPFASHDDQVDSVSQFLTHISKMQGRGYAAI